MAAETDPDDLRESVLRELRRARRYLLACAEGATEAQMERPARRGGACMKWHLGHAAFLERMHLARIAGPAGPDVQPGVLAFAPQGRDEREGDLPVAAELFGWLKGSRRIVEALASFVRLDEHALSVFRDIVESDYAQARFVRARRAECGLPRVPDPRSALLAADTDCEVPPRWRLPAFSVPVPEPARDGGVVSLADKRHDRALESLAEGHAHVGSGDVRAALGAFEEAARWEESAEALTCQAWMHSLLGDLDAAERLCLKAIRLDPDFGNPYNDIGTICVQRRDVQAAIQWFQRAKRAPRYEPRHFPFVNLGRLYMTLGMPREALRELEGALALAPDNDDVRSMIDTLRSQLRGG